MIVHIDVELNAQEAAEYLERKNDACKIKSNCEEEWWYIVRSKMNDAYDTTDKKKRSYKLDTLFRWLLKL